MLRAVKGRNLSTLAIDMQDAVEPLWSYLEYERRRWYSNRLLWHSIV